MTAEPFPRWAKITLIALPCAFVAIVFFCLIVSLNAPTSTAEAATTDTPVQATLAKVDPSVTGVSDGPGRTVVYIKTQGWDDASYAFTAGDVAQKIGQALQAGAPDGGQAPNVVVSVATTGVDRLGKESDLVLMAITFDRADLVAANFDNLSVGRTLNLATDITYGPAGARTLLAYCQTDRGVEQSGPFCRLAESRA